jgi:hypothetical protein
MDCVVIFQFKHNVLIVSMSIQFGMGTGYKCVPKVALLSEKLGAEKRET